MQTSLNSWLELYRYGSNTVNNNQSLDLPAAIASELVRLVMAESVIQVNGDTARSKYLDQQLQSFFRLFAAFRAEAAFALGGMAFKPYVSGDRIFVDMVRADRYVPTAFDDSGNATAAVFLSRKIIGRHYYTRLETHTWHAEDNTYTVENRAYCSLSDSALGSPCRLETVAGWEKLSQQQTIADVEHPLFAVFRVPTSNTIDPDSPMGVSVYAHAAHLICEANAQWARILWEFEATEVAVNASEDLFQRDRKTGKLRDLPFGNKRLFHKFSTTDNKLAEDLQVYSPAIRDVSLFNGLNHMLQRIEFNVGLAYGTLSEPTDIEKTAEEIRTSRQRSYVQVSKMQQSLQDALEQLLYAMDVYATLYGLAPSGNAELSCTWGDSVLEDTDKEFQRRLQLVTAGKLKAEKLLAWYFGCTEEEAKEYLPDSGLFGGGI